MERVWGESRADHEDMVGESRVTAGQRTPRVITTTTRLSVLPEVENGLRAELEAGGRNRWKCPSAVSSPHFEHYSWVLCRLAT